MKEIKIALYGQFDNDTKYAFTFPDDFNPAMTMTEREAWMRTISDPRDDARIFSTDRIYAVWRNAEGGNYYGLIVPNRKDTRNGYILLALYVGRQLPRSGAVVIDALRQLERMLIDEQVRDKQLVAQYVESIRQQFDDDTSMLPAPQKTLTRAYRLYGSEQELAELMAYPHQEAYAPFNRVLFVPQQAAPQQAIANFQQLTNSIRHSYAVSCPEGVSASRSSVMDGESFIVSYTKPGYGNQQYEITVKGPAAQLYTIEGGTLRVKSMQEAGIQFRRKARFRVFSAATNMPLSQFTIDGQRMQHDQEGIIKDQELLTFNIEAPGYHPQKLQVRLSELQRNAFLVQATLEPKEESVSIKASVDGQLVSGTARMTSDDPLLPYLRSNRHVISINSTQKVGNKVPPQHGKTAAKDGDKSWLKTLLIALGALIVGFLLGALLTGGGDEADDENDAPNATTNIVRQQMATAGQREEMEEEEMADSGPTEEELRYQKEQLLLEETDVKDYMKQNDVWMLNDLKSDKAREMFRALQQGDMSALRQNNYYLDMTPINGYWQQTAETIKQIDESGDEAKRSRCQEAMRQLTMNGKCVLKDLLSEVKGIKLSRAAGAAPGAAPAPAPAAGRPAASRPAGGSNRGSARGAATGGNAQGAAPTNRTTAAPPIRSDD